MKYVLLLMGHTDAAACGEPGAPAIEEYFEFDREITATGIVESSFALEGPDTAVAVTVTDDEEVITNGPFAEVKEFVGGAYVIDVPTIDDALEWARKSPGAREGHVEVRPLAPY